MATYLTPGLYLQEKLLPKPVQGQSTTVTAFLGIVPRGVRGKAIQVTSWTDFVNKFAYGLDSAFLPDAYLTYSVYGFFLNGGTRCYITGVANDQLAYSSYSFLTTDSAPVLKVSAADGGKWGDGVSIKLSSNGAVYDFEVYFNDELIKTYKSVSLTAGTANYIETLVNGIDKYVTVEMVGTGVVAASALGTVHDLEGGNDGTTGLTATDFIDTLPSLNNVEFSMLICPDTQDAAFVTEAIAYCEKRGEITFIMDGAESETEVSILDFRAKFNSSYAALYYPWIQVNDPIGTGSDRTKFVPVAGYIAGLVARTHNNRSVYKAAAGTNDGRIFGALGVKNVIDDVIQGTLNPVGVNAIRVFENEGIIVWGARCLDNTYLNIRMALNFLKASLRKGLRWVVFEPNNYLLWERMTTVVDAFLRLEYNNNKEGWKGETPEESFFIKCDSEINTPEGVRAGQVKIQAGVAIAEPAEFVIIEIGQWEGGSSAKEL
jgi:phage tail sheath protein FI